jgi:ribosomal protein S18 acetylase RimI-like enzyme
MIEYKPLIIDKDSIYSLYIDNKWYAYTNDFQILLKGIKHSTDCIGAYDGDTLIGLIRTVSDQATVCLIQDILILDSYKRKGVGKKLMQIVLKKYENIRQVQLVTDKNDERANAFYKEIGLKSNPEKGLIGYSK